MAIDDRIRKAPHPADFSDPLPPNTYPRVIPCFDKTLRVMDNDGSAVVPARKRVTSTPPIPN